MQQLLVRSGQLEELMVGDATAASSCADRMGSCLKMRHDTL